MMEISKLLKHAKTSKHSGKVFQGNKLDYIHDAATPIKIPLISQTKDTRN